MEQRVGLRESQSGSGSAVIIYSDSEPGFVEVVEDVEDRFRNEV